MIFLRCLGLAIAVWLLMPITAMGIMAWKETSAGPSLLALSMAILGTSFAMWIAVASLR